MKAPTALLMGVAFMLLAGSLCVWCLRQIGLSRAEAVYACLLIFSLFATFMVRRWNKSRTE